jgi:hypothetical protein
VRFDCTCGLGNIPHESLDPRIFSRYRTTDPATPSFGSGKASISVWRLVGLYIWGRTVVTSHLHANVLWIR